MPEQYGVKLSVIGTLDYADMKDIADAIEKLGFKITIADNGNFICEKVRT